MDNINNKDFDKANTTLKNLRVFSNQIIKRVDVASQFIDSFFETGLVLVLFEILRLEHPKCISMKIEASWLFINISAGNSAQISKLMEVNLIESYLSLMRDARNRNLELIENVFLLKI